MAYNFQPLYRLVLQPASFAGFKSGLVLYFNLPPTAALLREAILIRLDRLQKELGGLAKTDDQIDDEVKHNTLQNTIEVWVRVKEMISHAPDDLSVSKDSPEYGILVAGTYIGSVRIDNFTESFCYSPEQVKRYGY